MNGADFVCHALKKEGVEKIFGYPGGAVIPLFDSFYRNDFFDIVRPMHEQGASHAADGYARATGEVGVVVATSGPGITNTITGIATAYSDSVPMVVISGQVGKALMGKNSFQEVDIVTITMPITKYNVLVKDLKDLPDALARAFYEARSGRPGPVLVDICKNVFEEELIEEMTYESLGKSRDDGHGFSQEAILKAAELIKEAKDPVLYVGGGVLKADAVDEVNELIRQLNIPVVNSAMGDGVIDQMDPLSYGIVGMHGSRFTNNTVYNSDLIIGIGVRFSDRAIGHREGFTEKAKKIHFDIDVLEFNKNVDIDARVLGDLKETIPALLEAIGDITFAGKPYEEDSAYDNFLPKQYINTLQSVFPDNTNLTTDVGQHQMWALMYWKTRKPNTFFTSGGQGTMGFGVGATIGVKIAKPDEPVALITGDASFRMNHNEVLAMAKYGLGGTILIFDNKSLGMVRQWQTLFNEGRYAETDNDDPLDYEALATAYGVKFASVKNAEELKEALEKVDPLNDITLIHCEVNKDDGVYPMVAAGSGITDIIEESKLGF